MDAAASISPSSWMISRRGALLSLVVVAMTALWIRVLWLFRRDMRNARQSYQNLQGRQVIDTALGPVEVVMRFGSKQDHTAPPVLVVHGIFGGIDQGCLLAQNHLPQDCPIISVSRFGYLGTPLPPNIDYECDDMVQAVFHQADVYVALFDALNVDRAIAFGTSAGATSALAFAMQHSKRCAGLILLSPNAPGPTAVGLPPRFLAERLFHVDFIFWLIVTYFPGTLFETMGVPKGFCMTKEEREDVLGVVKTILPVSPRADGILLDMFVSNPAIQDMQVDSIFDTPTLFLSARDDPLTLYENSSRLSHAITRATLVTLPSGGHMLLGQQDAVRTEIASFLATVS